MVNTVPHDEEKLGTQQYSLKHYDAMTSPDSSQFKIIRSVRAEVPILNQESSMENLSMNKSREQFDT
jgi:hypothetical protein